ncbi:MAG TPA: hypothetical protein VNQ14_05670, partial [Woeseiaceae bacterium]|nr:hypothetical protein [Woeseiaceae bacterium]
MAIRLDNQTSRTTLPVFGTVVALLGLPLALGGGWLAALGGSWYYLLAGAGLLIAGTQLVRGRYSGTWWFALVFLGTLAWTIAEAGLDYWRWIPRFGLIVVLAFFLSLRLPRIYGRRSRLLGRSLAALCAVIFVAAFALAFLPHGVTRDDAGLPSGAEATVLPLSASEFAQPADAPADGDWAAWGRSNSALRFSPLTEINRTNVASLERAWVYRTGDLPENRWGAETTPLKIDDTLYLCTGRNILIAIDAGTGEERWRFDPEVPDSAIPYTAACRGVAYYEVPPIEAVADIELAGVDEAIADAAAEDADAGAEVDVATADTGPLTVSLTPLCTPRIISGTLDGRLIAVDAGTGMPCAGFGGNGEVDIKHGMGVIQPAMISITSAPTIVRGVVVTGHQVLDGQYRDAPSGVIQGFDAVTGELRWAWDMARQDRSGLPPEGESYTRGTPNMWTTASADEALGFVYLPMGNSAADYWSDSRTPPENEYSTSLVALDATTGRLAWHFQTVHVDVWDYDLGSQATLVDFPTANGPVPAVTLPTKQGDMYVLNRETGEPLTGVEERAVPQGGAEPENRSPTQPFSLYHTLQKPELTDRDMWGLTLFDQLYCRIQFQQASYEGMYTPPTADQHWIGYTGYNGGSDWGGIALDPNRGIIVANYNDMAMHNELVPREEAERRGYAPRAPKGAPGGAEGAGDPQIGTPYAVNVNAGWMVPFTGLLCKEPPYGGIRAIELATGRTLWDRPFGTARANGPFGIRSMLPIEIGTPNNGGAAV